MYGKEKIIELQISIVFKMLALHTCSNSWLLKRSLVCFWQVKTFTCAWLWSRGQAQLWDHLTTHLPAFSRNSLERKLKTRREKEQGCWPWWPKKFLFDEFQDKLPDKTLFNGILAQNKIQHRLSLNRKWTSKQKDFDFWKWVCVFACVCLISFCELNGDLWWLSNLPRMRNK